MRRDNLKWSRVMDLDDEEADITELQRENRKFYSKVTQLLLRFESMAKRKDRLVKGLRNASMFSQDVQFHPTSLMELSSPRAEMFSEKFHMKPVKTFSDVKHYLKLLQKAYAKDEYGYVETVVEFTGIWNDCNALRRQVKKSMWLPKYYDMPALGNYGQRSVAEIGKTLSIWDEIQSSHYDFSEMYKDPVASTNHFGDHFSKNFHYSLNHRDVYLYGGVVMILPQLIDVAFKFSGQLKEFCKATMQRVHVIRVWGDRPEHLIPDDEKFNASQRLASKNFARDAANYSHMNNTGGSSSLSSNSSLSSDIDNSSFPSDPRETLRLMGMPNFNKKNLRKTYAKRR